MDRILNKSYETLYIVISTGQSKELLEKNIILNGLNKISDEKIETYYKMYEVSYAQRINDNLIDAVYRMYAFVLNRYLFIGDTKKLVKDLQNNYILTSKLKSVTNGLAATFGKFVAIAELGTTTLKHIKRPQETELDNTQEHIKQLNKELQRTIIDFAKYLIKNLIKYFQSSQIYCTRRISDSYKINNLKIIIRLFDELINFLKISINFDKN